MPRLRSRDLTEAHPEVRATWFELFSGYCIESEADKGVLLALKEPEFDERLMDLLEKLMEDEGEYPY